MSAVTFTVRGIALPQGSKSARVVGKGDAKRAVMTEGFGDGARRRRSWREAVSTAAREAAAAGPIGLLDGPLALTVCFYLPRPRSAPKRVWRPATKPDASKLARALEDSLTGILIADDARIVQLHVEKWYATESTPPCAVVRVESAHIGAIPALFPPQAVAS